MITNIILYKEHSVWGYSESISRNKTNIEKPSGQDNAYFNLNCPHTRCLIPQQRSFCPIRTVERVSTTIIILNPTHLESLASVQFRNIPFMDKHHITTSFHTLSTQSPPPPGPYCFCCVFIIQCLFFLSVTIKSTNLRQFTVRNALGISSKL